MIKSQNTTINARIKAYLRNSKFAPQIKAFLDVWRQNILLNRIRRIRTALFLPIKVYRSKEVKLHLGCGNVHLDGYINIDMNQSSATDFVANITKLPIAKNTVDRIEMYHVIEHMTEKVAQNSLQEYFSLLKDGGVIIIECPDLENAIKEYIAGNQQRIYNIYGRNRFPGDAHRFGYTSGSLVQLLKSTGFQFVKTGEPTDYHRLEEPCLRVEARKS